MTTESFEYAVRKDVRNNPIVREVDRERHRDMFRSLGTGVLLVVVLLFWAWQQFELLRHGYRVRADAAGTRDRGRGEPASAPRDRNAERAGPDRAEGHDAARHGRAGTGRRHRRRARRAGGRAAQLRRSPGGRNDVTQPPATCGAPPFPSGSTSARSSWRCGRWRSSGGSCTCRSCSTTTWRSAPSGSSSGRSRRRAKRADIVDRNGQLLAYSVEADTIYAVPTEIGDPLPASASPVPRARRLHGAGSRRAGRSDPARARRSSTCAARCRPSRRAGWPSCSWAASAS